MAKGNPKPSTKFEPGNQAAKGADHSGRRVMTQQLISALNEGYQEWVPPELDNDGKEVKKGHFRQTEITNMRRVIDNLISNATRAADQQAINAIIDRVDGKVPQAITGEDGGPVEVHITGGLPTSGGKKS